MKGAEQQKKLPLLRTTKLRQVILYLQLFNKYNFVFEAIRENGHFGFRILHFNQ